MPERRFSIFGDASQGHHSSRYQRAFSLFRNFPEIRHALCKGRQSDSRRQPPVAKRYHAPTGGRCRASTPDRNRTDGSWFQFYILEVVIIIVIRNSFSRPKPAAQVCIGPCQVCPLCRRSRKSRSGEFVGETAQAHT